MNYLELCQQTVLEAGLSGKFSTVTTQGGDFSRLVVFVRNACTQVEGQWINWRFRRRTWDVTLVEGIDTYSPPEALRVETWDPNRAYIDKLKTDVKNYDEYEPSAFTDDYTGEPDLIVINNDNTLRTIGTPDQEYSLSIDFFKQPTTLINNDDRPAMPERFHRIIVLYALKAYGMYDEAPELIGKADLELYGMGGYEAGPMPGSWLAQLQASQLPGTLNAGASTGGQFEVVAS